MTERDYFTDPMTREDLEAALKAAGWMPSTEHPEHEGEQLRASTAWTPPNPDPDAQWDGEMVPLNRDPHPLDAQRIMRRLADGHYPVSN